MIYSEELSQQIANHIRFGMSQKDACALQGVGESTFYQWRDEKPDFAELMKSAVLECKRRNMGLIQKAAIKSWTAAAWYLERRYPDEFALRQKHEIGGITGDGDKAPIKLDSTVQVKMDVASMSEEDLKKLISIAPSLQPQNEQSSESK